MLTKQQQQRMMGKENKKEKGTDSNMENTRKLAVMLTD